MKTWELMKWAAEGAYIAGDTFINELGEQLVFNGHVLIGSCEINPLDKWELKK